MTRRRLKPDELELWRQVARSAQPLPKALRRDDCQEPKSPDPVAQPVAPVSRLTAFEIGQSHPSRNESHLPPQTLTQRLKTQPLAMDARTHGRMKRGKLAPEARIDLHGMTLDQAHPELVRFVLTAQARGLRLILVITGKGQREDPYSPMPMRRGVLRQKVPMWLRTAPLAPMILQVTEAHQRHGGSGAFYVYLRRSR